MEVGRFSDAPKVFFFFPFSNKIGNKTSSEWLSIQQRRKRDKNNVAGWWLPNLETVWKWKRVMYPLMAIAVVGGWTQKEKETTKNSAVAAVEKLFSRYSRLLLLLLSNSFLDLTCFLTFPSSCHPHCIERWVIGNEWGAVGRKWVVYSARDSGFLARGCTHI